MAFIIQKHIVGDRFGLTAQKHYLHDHYFLGQPLDIIGVMLKLVASFTS